jgi:Enterochelin esterase and related enzymes
MSLINPPSIAPEGVTHRTFFSKLIDSEIGYNIYLPPCYETGDERYPVTYHLHGYTGNESSDIWVMNDICKANKSIMVFANGTPDNGYINGKLPMDSIITTELVPFIDAHYGTIATREARTVTGFSMGGAGAFYYAVKYPELFGSVVAYAGTYHHFYHKGSRTVGIAKEEIAAVYESMIDEKRYLEEGNILNLVYVNADKLRGKSKIALHVGTEDVLFCDNEIMHMFLDRIDIPHTYKTFDGVEHQLDKILR